MHKTSIFLCNVKFCSGMAGAANGGSISTRNLEILGQSYMKFGSSIAKKISDEYVGP